MESYRLLGISTILKINILFVPHKLINFMQFSICWILGLGLDLKLTSNGSMTHGVILESRRYLQTSDFIENGIFGQLEKQRKII